MRRLALVLLFAATLAYAIGISQPLVVIKRLLILSETPSLIAMVGGLWSAGEPLLALVVALFSIAFPAAKLLALLFTAADPDGVPPAWLTPLAQWSMLDVVLVALVIFAAKTSGLATALSQPGLWFFAVSVLLSAAASAVLKTAKRPPPAAVS